MMQVRPMGMSMRHGFVRVPVAVARGCRLVFVRVSVVTIVMPV